MSRPVIFQQLSGTPIFTTCLSVGSRLLAVLGFIQLMGCASTPFIAVEETCPVQDWFEQGRQDGQMGKPEIEILEYQKKCPDLSRELYTNGRLRGITQYCTPQNALELGRLQKSYQAVCPAHLEASFLESYRRGQRILRLEEDNAAIDGEIAELTGGRQPAQIDAEAGVHTKLRDLQRRRSVNVSEIEKLSKKNDHVLMHM